MTDHEIDALVTQANPLDDAALAALELDGADVALLDGLLAGGAGTAPPSPRRRRRPRRTLLAAFAVAALAAFAVIALTGDDPGDSGSAWAAPLVRLAESSPLLLIDDPGWRVRRADETDRTEGEMTFVRGAEPIGAEGGDEYFRRRADLHWRRGSLAMWQRDRAHDAPLVVKRTVLGRPAQISQYPQHKGMKDFTAIWAEDGRVLEFRAVAAGLAAFERLVGSLKRVSVDAWLSAMPASVVKAANRPVVVREMLADIPLPPGFSSAKLERGEILSDRYQLGAQVTGAVACAWFDRWDAARKRGDEPAVDKAIAAMRTAEDWKILEEMKRQGAWTEVLLAYADAMRGDGLWHGRPLKGDVESGLGCGRR